ncbi:MAG TPA: dephospho-CoA kinase [Methylomirabilota bacterium]|nr:dephospho-CoA kinase [Methylomirabilota bacterium]
MLRLGLTGGIASGKSAVAAMLRELGFPVLDADSLAHRLIEPGKPAHDAVVREFGHDIQDPTGKIDRAKLGAAVFGNREKLERLNSIVHPLVKQEIQRQFAEWDTAGRDAAAFAEAALILEAGYQDQLDGVVVAWCRPEQQLERLRARGMSAEEASKRIAAQMPVEEKLRRATERIDCSGTLEQTRAQVQALAERLRRTKPQAANLRVEREGRSR